MKKTIISLIILLVYFSAGAQQTDSISILKKRVDLLQSRLDEKNYTRVPNKDLEDAFKTKVKEEVNGWFSSNFFVGGGILAALVALILTVGRRIITKELDGKLKTYVEKNTTDISNRFDDYRANIKSDFADFKISINNKLGDVQDDIKKYRQESLETIEKFKTETEESFDHYVDDKLKQTDIKVSNLQDELNETVSPLFNQSVEGILQRAKVTKNQKDEELIKYLEKLFKREKLPSEKSAAEALEAIVLYYYYRLNTDKMVTLIKDYGTRYNLSAVCYANAALAFLDKYETSNQVEFRNNCLNYCDEAIKRSFDYGIAHVVKIYIYLIDYERAFDDTQKEAAFKEVKRIFNQVRFTQSAYIAKDIIEEIKSIKDGYLKQYIEVLETEFADEIKELNDRIVKIDGGNPADLDLQSQSSS